jgi:hypothetical protein
MKIGKFTKFEYLKVNNYIKLVENSLTNIYLFIK